MFRSRTVVTAALLLCSCKGAPKEQADATSDAGKASRCEAIAKKTGNMALAVTGALSLAAENDAKALQASQAEAKAELTGVVAELRERCMTWPDRTLKCLDSPLWAAGHRDECERAVAEAMGEPLPPTDVEAGPSPSWTYTFPGDPEPLLTRDGGWMLARTHEYRSDDDPAGGVSKHWLTAVRDGAKLWEQERFVSAQILDLGAQGIGVLASGSLELLDPETGPPRRVIELTGKEQPDFDAEYDSAPSIATFAPHPDGGLMLGDEDARFYRADDEGTITLLGQLNDEMLDSDARLFVRGGRTWLWEGYDLRAFDDAWKTSVNLGARESLSAVQFADGHLLLLIDDEVVRVDPAQCGGTRPIAVSQWPHRGDMRFGDEDECEGCIRPPAGCVVWRAHVRDISHEPMASLAGGVVVNDSTQTMLLRDGAPAWKSATAAGGPTAVGSAVYVVSPGNEEDAATKLWALDPGSGAPQWVSTLPAQNDSWMYSTDDIHVQTRGAWLYAGFESSVSAFELSPTPSNGPAATPAAP